MTEPWNVIPDNVENVLLKTKVWLNRKKKKEKKIPTRCSSMFTEASHAITHPVSAARRRATGPAAVTIFIF